MFPTHLVTADWSVRLNDSILHYEWNWDPLNFLPAGEMEQMAEALKHIGELRLHHPDLTLVPLKSDYFNGGDYRNFRKWDRLDLVRRFKNSGKIYTQVYDKMCMNPECPRRKPDYKPREGEKINSTCGSVHCKDSTCRLVACRGEDYCFDHHPRSAVLMKQAPNFRVVIYDDAHLRHADPFIRKGNSVETEETIIYLYKTRTTSVQI